MSSHYLKTAHTKFRCRKVLPHLLCKCTEDDVIVGSVVFIPNNVLSLCGRGSAGTSAANDRIADDVTIGS